MCDFFKNPITPAYAEKKFEANKTGFLRDFDRAKKLGVTPGKEHVALHSAILMRTWHVVTPMRVLEARDTLADCVCEQQDKEL